MNPLIKNSMINNKLTVLIKNQLAIQADIQNIVGLIENNTDGNVTHEAPDIKIPVMTNKNFDLALTKFLAEMHKRLQAHLDTYKGMDWKANLIITKGSKYYKIIDGGSSNSGKSVEAFINRTTGDIMKAASWKIPAKHARGNIFDADHGAKALNAQGRIRYLK